VCELAIRDLKAGAGLAHLPSGRFAANSAWLLAPPWPTTCCAGPPGSVWAATASNWSPRRCAGHCSCCPAGSPAAGGSGRCTYPPAGRGPTHSPWRWLGCAASPTRPDRTPTPSLGSSATRRPLRPARHSVAPTTKPLNDHQSTPSAARSCGQPSLFASIRTPCPDRVRKTATAFADRWIQADIPQCMSEPLPASLLSVTESGQQKGAGR
jgi:hypothetical protein